MINLHTGNAHLVATALFRGLQVCCMHDCLLQLTSRANKQYVYLAACVLLTSEAGACSVHGQLGDDLSLHLGVSQGSLNDSLRRQKHNT